MTVQRPRDLFSAFLLAGGFLFLAASILAALHSIALGLPHLVSWSVGEAATACAGFGTVSAVLLALYQFVRQWRNSGSKFALDMAMEGVRRSHAVLTASRPTTNVAWVNGARLLLHAEKMTEQMTEDEHFAAWNLFKEEWRIRFYDLIARPAEYYFGISESSGDNLIDVNYEDEVLKRFMERATFTPSIVMTGRQGIGSDSTMLSVRAIKVIFDFVQFPEKFRETDNLQTVGDFTQADIDKLDISGRWGLYAYIRARKKWTAAFGKVHEISNIPEEIDEQEG